jgi:hypothetical protein
LLDELDEPPELELELELVDDEELELELELRRLELELELKLERLLDEDEGAVGLPPHPLSGLIPSRAAPPESRIRNSRRSDRHTSSSRLVLPGAFFFVIVSILPGPATNPPPVNLSETALVALNRPNDPYRSARGRLSPPGRKGRRRRSTSRSGG